MEGIMFTPFTIEQMDKQLAFTVRTRSPQKDLGNVIGKTYNEIMTYMSSINEAPTGLPFIGYFNMDMDDLDIEIGMISTKTLPNKDPMHMSEISEGKFVVTVHTGPYETLVQTYNEMMKWIGEQGLDASGIGYELYLNAPGQVADEELETKILMGLKG